MYKQVFAVNLRYAPLQWTDIKDFFSVQFRSFWGVFGWMNVSSPGWLYRFWGILCILGLLGLIVRVLQHRPRKQSSPEQSSSKNSLALFPFIAFLAQEAYMLAVITQCNPSCYQGRYLFPAIAPIGVTLAWGLTGLLLQQRKITSIVAFSGVSALIAISIWVPVGVLRPAYQTVTIPTWRLLLIPHKTDFSFGDMFRLRGYDFHIGENSSMIILELYWQALQQPDFNYWTLAKNGYVDG